MVGQFLSYPTAQINSMQITISGDAWAQLEALAAAQEKAAEHLAVDLIRSAWSALEQSKFQGPASDSAELPSPNQQA